MADTTLFWSYETEVDAWLELIYERVDLWHITETELTIYEWLGWTHAEYAAFVENPRNPVPR